MLPEATIIKTQTTKRAAAPTNYQVLEEMFFSSKHVHMFGLFEMDA